jgi:hypothetical protein
LYSTKRESKYNRRDNDRSVAAAGFFLAAILAIPIILIRLGFLSPSFLHLAQRTLVGWWTTLGTVNSVIVACVFVIAVFSTLVWVVHQYRHRHDPIDITLPPITPPACTFFSRDFVLGQGCTEDGLQPGDIFPATRDDSDILPEFNVFIRAEGAFQNTKLEGAPGTGKSKAIESLIAQAVRKYPSPPDIPRDESGAWFPVPSWDTDEHERVLTYVEHERRRYLAWETRSPREFSKSVQALRRWRDKRHGGEHFVNAAGDPVLTAAYGGLGSEEEVITRNAQLAELHSRRPTILVINAKPESDGKSLVDHLVRCAAADSPERAAQVYLVSPDLGTSVAMFDLARTNADLASTIATTISIVDGETDRFWTSQMTSVVACLVGVMKALMPGRITWLTLLNLLRSKETFDNFVSDAQARFNDQAEAERKNERVEGPLVNHVELSELQRFAELDIKKFTETTAQILNFGGKLTAGDLVRTMAPEVPTFGTMDEVVREGGLLGIDMPLTRYQDVSRAVNTMLVNAYVAAIMEVARTTPSGEMRDSYIFIDEAASYMTEVLERALSQNRSAQMGAFLAYQIRTQFDATETSASKTLGTTCANTISFRDPDGISAELKSKSYGMVETMVEDFGITESLGRVQGTKGKAGSDGGGLTQSGSIRQSIRDVPRFKPEIVQSLPQGHAIVMVSDGRNPYPARRIRILRTVDIPWLADIDKVNRSARDYVPPIPMCVLSGNITDWTAVDRLKVLAEASDPTRDDVFAMRTLWSCGEIWGVLLFTRTFACVIESKDVEKHSALIERALSGILKPGYSTPNKPTVVLVNEEDGRKLVQSFGFDLSMPFPIVQAAEAIQPPSPARITEARTAAAGLSPDVDAYLSPSLTGVRASVRGVQWFMVSQAMRTVLDIYRDVDGYLRNFDSTLPQHLRAEWADAVADDGPVTGPPQTMVNPQAITLTQPTITPPAPAQPIGPPIPVQTTPAPAATHAQGKVGRRRGAAAVPTVDAVLSFLQGNSAPGNAPVVLVATTPAVAVPTVAPIHFPSSADNDITQSAVTHSASQPATVGSVETGSPGVLDAGSTGVEIQGSGVSGVLESDAPADNTSVPVASASTSGDVGIPRDNPFDI